jgi:hypothetical protein
LRLTFTLAISQLALLQTFNLVAYNRRPLTYALEFAFQFGS